MFKNFLKSNDILKNFVYWTAKSITTPMYANDNLEIRIGPQRSMHQVIEDFLED